MVERLAVAPTVTSRATIVQSAVLTEALVVLGLRATVSAQRAGFTITFEKDNTVFETIFALDLATPISRVGVTLEAITKPFSDENEVELESELKLYWLESAMTGNWISSHFDVVDKFSPAERSSDGRAYTHKLNLELDTAVAIFSRLPEDNWWRDVELEGSLDYVATGLPSGAPRWSFSIVFVIPVVRGR